MRDDYMLVEDCLVYKELPQHFMHERDATITESDKNNLDFKDLDIEIVYGSSAQDLIDIEVIKERW